MSFLRRLWSGPYRKARRAEGAGDYRRAAALYAEAGAAEEAANALLFHAARAPSVDERVTAYRDALRWLPEDHPRTPDVEAQIGLALLDDARRRGAHTDEERRRVEEAAERLERAARHAEAAQAWELLGRTDDVVRCLQEAGEVERLEALLDGVNEERERERKVRGLVRDYELAMAVGARREARQALREAQPLAPGDAGIADLLRRLEDRWLPAPRVTLHVGDRPVVVSGRLPLVLGREGDLRLRGTSVSRRHTEVDRDGDALVVRDLDSRNGTLLRGVPIAGEVRLSGEVEVGLGDDVSVLLRPAGEGVSVEVSKGLDRGALALAGSGTLPVPGAPATLRFTEAVPVLSGEHGATVTLAGQRCAAPVELLRDDVLDVSGVRLSVARG